MTRSTDPVTFGDLEDINESIEVIIGMLTLKPGGPWNWAMLHPEAQEALWEQLFNWVSWLEERYVRHLDRDAYPLPGCWYQHPVAVELMTSLMVAHMAVYQEAATTASSALVDWHERCFWPTMTRLRESGVVRACAKANKHTAEDDARALLSSAEDFAKFRVAAATDLSVAG